MTSIIPPPVEIATQRVPPVSAGEREPVGVGVRVARVDRLDAHRRAGRLQAPRPSRAAARRRPPSRAGRRRAPCRSPGTRAWWAASRPGRTRPAASRACRRHQVARQPADAQGGGAVRARRPAHDGADHVVEDADEHTKMTPGAAGRPSSILRSDRERPADDLGRGDISWQGAPSRRRRSTARTATAGDSRAAPARPRPAPRPRRAGHGADWNGRIGFAPGGRAARTPAAGSPLMPVVSFRDAPSPQKGRRPATAGRRSHCRISSLATRSPTARCCTMAACSSSSTAGRRHRAGVALRRRRRSGAGRGDRPRSRQGSLGRHLEHLRARASARASSTIFRPTGPSTPSGASDSTAGRG